MDPSEAQLGPNLIQSGSNWDPKGPSIFTNSTAPADVMLTQFLDDLCKIETVDLNLKLVVVSDTQVACGWLPRVLGVDNRLLVFHVSFPFFAA